jgi:hypothetical protein
VSGPGQAGTRRLLAAALAALTAAVFFPVRDLGFVWDDYHYLHLNPLFAAGPSLESAGRTFVSFHSANWHPVTWLSHMADLAFFGYYRDNPVTVSPATKRTDNLRIVRRTAPVVTAGGNPELVRVEGVVLGPSGPAVGAAIHVYTDASEQFRGPDRFGLQSAVMGRTDTKGAFSFDLPSGSYFIVASKRTGGDLAAPFQPGDLYGYYDGNPLALEPGTKTAIIIQVVEGVDSTTGHRRDATSTP